MARAKMDKQFGCLKLKVNCSKHFLEHKNMANLQGNLGIFSNNESTSPHPPSSAFVDGPDGNRVEPHHRDREFGSVFTHTHISVNDTPHSISLPCGIENSHDNNYSFF
jgi:hypothetical protein